MIEKHPPGMPRAVFFEYKVHNIFASPEWIPINCPYQDVLLCRDYDDSVVASFANQIQSEYCSGNRSVSIEGIALENFSTLPSSGINISTKSCPRHAVFKYFLSDNIEQDAVTTTPYSKRLIELLKERKLLESALSTIWKNTDGCAEQYIFASALYLMSVMTQCYSVIIDSGISAPGHDK